MLRKQVVVICYILCFRSCVDCRETGERVVWSQWGESVECGAIGEDSGEWSQRKSSMLETVECSSMLETVECSSMLESVECSSKLESVESSSMLESV